jgi:hypothetical protein
MEFFRRSAGTRRRRSVTRPGRLSLTETPTGNWKAGDQPTGQRPMTRKPTERAAEARATAWVAITGTTADCLRQSMAVAGWTASTVSSEPARVCGAREIERVASPAVSASRIRDAAPRRRTFAVSPAPSASRRRSKVRRAGDPTLEDAPFPECSRLPHDDTQNHGGIAAGDPRSPHPPARCFAASVLRASGGGRPEGGELRCIRQG